MKTKELCERLLAITEPTTAKLADLNKRCSLLITIATTQLTEKK